MGHREGPHRSQVWGRRSQRPGIPMAVAMAPGCLYLVLTLVPEGLRRQVIDGQGPIQVANSCQRHPGQRRVSRQLVEGPGLGVPQPRPPPPSPLLSCQAEAPLTLTHCKSPRTPRSWTRSPPLLPDWAGRPRSRV